MALISEQADMHQLPHPRGEPLDQRGITIGDLHGNALKLIYFLVREGVLVVDDPDYQDLVNIYKKQKLNASDLKAFDELLSKMQVKPVGLVRLIGDEMADRGKNDCLTLKVLVMLRKKGVPVEILLSNHSVEFIEAYEKGGDLTPPRLELQHAGSLFALNGLVRQGLVSKAEVLAMVDYAYKPFLRALSYTLSPDESEITIYSHAPIDEAAIKQLARKLEVNYERDTAKKLAESIDKINQKFSEHVINNTVHTLYDASPIRCVYSAVDPGSYDCRHDPFTFLMWNRNYKVLDRSHDILGQNTYVRYVHGHDPNGYSIDNTINLDNHLGKPSNSSGQYTIWRTDEGVAPSLDNTDAPGVDEKYSSLLSSIDAMEAYGESLMSQDYIKGVITSGLAADLKKMVQLFASDNSANFDEFKETFNTKLHSQDAIMNEHRAAWKPILLNIAIALTGVGLLVLAGKLIQSKVSTGQCTFFAANTKRQQQINAIDKVIKGLQP